MTNQLIIEDLEEAVAPPSAATGSLSTSTADGGAIVFVAAIVFVSFP